MAAGYSTQVPFIFSEIPPKTFIYSLRYGGEPLKVNDIIRDVHVDNATYSGSVWHIRDYIQAINGGNVYLLQGTYEEAYTADYFNCHWGNVFASTTPFTITINDCVIYSDDIYNDPTTYSSRAFTYQGKTAYYLWLDISGSRSGGILGYTSYEVTNKMNATVWNSFDNGQTDNADHWAWLVLYGDNAYINNPYNVPPTGEGGDVPRGGTGTWDDHSDVIPVDPLPTGAWGQGFVSVYNPTVAELQNFATQLWREDLRNTWNDIFPNGGVTSGIVSCITIPVQPDTSSSGQIHVGGVAIASTSAAILANRFKVVDFGIAPIRYTMEHFGGFQDYLCTKIGIYLPYIGWESLSPEMVLNCQLGLQYKIDCFTGDFIAVLTTYRTDKFSYQGVSYTFNGNCATQVPITSQSGGSGASMISSAISGLSALGNLFTGNIPGVVAGGAAAINNIGTESGKHSFALAGGLTGSKGQLAQQRPYLCIDRPVMEDGVKNNYFNLCGIPSNDYASISDCVGFTKAFEVKLDSTAFNEASDEELNAIVELLKDGIFCSLK